MATTTWLDEDIDLLAVAGSEGVLFEQNGTGLAGRGVALRLELPVGRKRLVTAAEEVAAALGAIGCDDDVGRPGTGPLAFAALPFAEDTQGEVLVPAVVVGKTGDGARWITRVGPPHSVDMAVLAPSHPPLAAMTGYRVNPSRPPSEWCEAVSSAVAAIRAGDLHKVVLARQVLVEADAPIPIRDVLEGLRASYPTAMTYSVGGFLGASPELLVSRSGNIVRSHPMAGTVARSSDPAADARRAASLLASEKDRAEHQVTIDMVLDVLLPFCSFVDSEPEPSVVALANVSHLASLVEGRLSSPPAPVLALVAALHPTPAVCGWPRDEALALIRKLEGFDRGRYAGAVGWTDAQGNGRFAVGIRGAEISGTRARLYAGNGIVAGSDPLTELAETRAKLQAMLSAIVRP